MRLTTLFVVAAVGSVALQSEAMATSFTMTTEAPGSLGFIDTDTIKVIADVGSALTYTIYQKDENVPSPATSIQTGARYAASAAELQFQCTTRRYSLVKLLFYDAHGRFVGSYDKPVVIDQALPPQTGVEEQFAYVCSGAAPKNRIDRFNDLETPLQTLIRSARATLNDPAYVP